MAQTARDSRLETRTARLKLKLGERHYKSIGKGLALVYRRTGTGFGTWSAKVASPEGKYALRALGAADDYQDANGVDVLSFTQAHDRARQLAHEAKANDGILVRPASVAEAADRYLAWYREHRRSVRSTEHAIDAHIRPTLGDRKLDTLTAAHIQSWLERLAAKPPRVRRSRLAKEPAYGPAPQSADDKRARKASANRILNVLKAILNRAFRDGLVADDTPWRKVRPFEKADQARIRFLTDAEAMRLSNACDPDLRSLVRAALLTGCRFGELVTLPVHDVDLRAARIYIAQSKSGRPRHVPLNAEGLSLFRECLRGKNGEELAFVRSDGRAWGKNHHVRALAAACRAAKIKPDVAFHELRHTYASHLAQAGVDLLTISKLLGHADTRITAKHYAHLADRTLAAAVERLPSFESKKSHRPLDVVDKVALA